MNLAVIPSMQKNHFGRIVNTTSVTGIHGNYSTPGYTASKAAAICQTKAFAMKYGKDNITVNAVAPGMVDTPMKIDATPEEYDYVASITPLGKVADPVDIARCILFFAQENLFAPLGIVVEKDIVFGSKEEQLRFNRATDVSGWVADPMGVNTAGWGLTLSAMDMAKIGQLYLNRGVWNGRQLVPESWWPKAQENTAGGRPKTCRTDICGG